MRPSGETVLLLDPTTPALDSSGMTMKLRQGQLWQQGDTCIRIVTLERLEVGYKLLTQPTSKEGTNHRVSKKEFCRLLKNARLLPPSAKLSAPSAGPQPPASHRERAI